MRKGSGASGGVRSRRSEEGKRGARKSRECAAGRGVRASASSLPAARARAGMPAVGMNPFIRTSSSGAAMNCRVPGLASDGSVRPTVGILQQPFRRKKDQFPWEVERANAEAPGSRSAGRKGGNAEAPRRKGAEMIFVIGLASRHFRGTTATGELSAPLRLGVPAFTPCRSLRVRLAFPGCFSFF